MINENYKKEFIEFLIDSNALMFGNFITKSGRNTPYFINTGKFRTGEQIMKLGQFYAKNIYQQIKHGTIDNDIKFLFGPAYKGIPLVITTSIALCEYGIDISYCFNRKENKDHGEGGNIIGYDAKPGDKALIIEDVITAGTAVREILPILKEKSVDIKGLIISVDRMEKGENNDTAINSLYSEERIKTFPIINVRDILSELYNDSDYSNSIITKDTYSNMMKYIDRYCI